MEMGNLERWAIEANIVRFQELLKSADDEDRREHLKQLLLREQEKLKKFSKRS